MQERRAPRTMGRLSKRSCRYVLRLAEWLFAAHLTDGRLRAKMFCVARSVMVVSRHGYFKLYRNNKVGTACARRRRLDTPHGC